jgi:hypothetical protein
MTTEARMPDPTSTEREALEHGLNVYGRMLDLDDAHIEDAVRTGMRAAVAFALKARPDEQAIERAARALASRRRPLGHGLGAVLAARIAREAREDVLVVLAAALEQPG